MSLPEMGLHEGVPFDIYQSWDAVSNSRLSLFNISPAHYQVGYKPSTKSMDVGSVVHSVVLEDQKFAVIPPFNLDEPDEDGKGGNKDAKGKPSTSKNTTYYKHKVELFAAARWSSRPCSTAPRTARVPLPCVRHERCVARRPPSRASAQEVCAEAHRRGRRSRPERWHPARGRSGLR